MKTVDFFWSMPENKIAVQNFSLIFLIQNGKFVKNINNVLYKDYWIMKALLYFVI